MTPTGFMNGQYKSRCYVNSSFQVLFFNILFRTLIMNIYCEKNIGNMDNSSDDYRGYIQKIMILQVIQHIFGEILIGGRNVFSSDIVLQSIISGQMFKMILQSFKGYFTKWCQRNPLLSKRYVTLTRMAK